MNFEKKKLKSPKSFTSSNGSNTNSSSNLSNGVRKSRIKNFYILGWREVLEKSSKISNLVRIKIVQGSFFNHENTIESIVFDEKTRDLDENVMSIVILTFNRKWIELEFSNIRNFEKFKLIIFQWTLVQEMCRWRMRLDALWFTINWIKRFTRMKKISRIGAKSLTWQNMSYHTLDMIYFTCFSNEFRT